MRILCVTPWFPRYKHDSFGSFIQDSLLALEQLGCEITVLITQPWRLFKKKNMADNSNQKLTILHCRYLSLPKAIIAPISHWFYQKTVSNYIRKLLAAGSYDLLHAQTELAGMAVVKVGLEFNIPTLMTVHGISTESKLYLPTSRRMLFEYPVKNVTRLILVGQPLVKFCQQFVSSVCNFRVIANGFKFVAMQSCQEKFPSNCFIRFISVSNLQEGKGIDLNLQALAKLNELGIKTWSYHVVGDGSDRKKLELMTQKLDLEEQVWFSGRCDHDQVYTHLNQADVFILPSYREAFGIAYLEAMACGLLCVGVIGQGVNDYISHRKTGLLVAPKNVADLVSKLKYIFTAYDEVRSIALKGRELVFNNYTWRHHAIKLLTVYQECLGGTSAPNMASIDQQRYAASEQMAPLD